MILFQSTLPREERLIFFQVKTCANTFQSTLPREERPKQNILLTPIHNFNPRSHERSDGKMVYNLLIHCISIHAPTRGATLSQMHKTTEYYFNPRSHERSDTVTSSTFTLITINFNPRSHERSDCAGLIFDSLLIISIHAPTRGATNWVHYPPISQVFQSTLPREERLGYRSC